jgi:hypothetical protein
MDSLRVDDPGISVSLPWRCCWFENKQRSRSQLLPNGNISEFAQFVPAGGLSEGRSSERCQDANKGALATITTTTDANEPSQMLLLIGIFCALGSISHHVD